MSRRVRPLEPRDLPGLLAVQRACYGEDFIESAAVFARRLACPANCSLAVEQEGSLVAYLAAYRSVLGKVTPLHGDFEAVPVPDTLYLHDMAVHPALAGQGLARALLVPLLQSARAGGLRHTALVSVQDSQAYWARQGYARRALHGAAQQHLASYGSGAVYMAQVLQEQ